MELLCLQERGTPASTGLPFWGADWGSSWHPEALWNLPGFRKVVVGGESGKPPAHPCPNLGPAWKLLPSTRLSFSHRCPGLSTCLPQGHLQPVLLGDGELANEFPAVFQLLHLDLQPPGVHAAPTLRQHMRRAPQRSDSHGPSAQLRLEGLPGPREEASLLGTQAAQPSSHFLSSRGFCGHAKLTSPQALRPPSQQWRCKQVLLAFPAPGRGALTHLMLLHQRAHQVSVPSHGGLLSQLGLGPTEPVQKALKSIAKAAREQQVLLQLLLPAMGWQQ